MATPFQVLTNSFAGSVDPVNDTIPYWQNSTSSAFSITRNKFLNLASAPVGLTDTQTLTGKTLTSPTISGPTLSGTVLGTYTLGGTPTFPATVVTTTATQTLTGKTITGAAISGGSIDNATVTVDTVAGHTTANAGTIYGISVTGGALTSGALGTNIVTAPKLATNALLLGSVTSTSTFTTTSTTSVQVTGMSTTVTIPAGGRMTKITVSCSIGISTLSQAAISIWDGTVGSGTKLQEVYLNGTVNWVTPATPIALVSPAAGTKTYNVGFSVSTGTGTLFAGTGAPAFLIVEAL